MNAVTPRALPSAAPSRYVSAAAARPETGTLGMPTQQQILNQQINLASTNASPATMQTLLNNPRFEQMLRDPQQARMLHDNPAFKAILPKLKEEADRLPTTGTGPDGNPINPRQTMTNRIKNGSVNVHMTPFLKDGLFGGVGSFRRQGDLCRNTECSRASRDILGDDGVRADLRIIGDGDIADQFRACADHHAVADGGMAFAEPAFAAQGDTVEDQAVIADFGGFADDHAHAVIDDQIFADACAGVDFNASEQAGDFAHQAREERNAPCVKGTPSP